MNREAMMRVITGFMPARVLGVAAQLRIVDELSERCLTADELARRVGAQPAALARLLRALEGMDVVIRTTEGWSVGSSGRLLMDIPGSLRGLAVTHTGEMMRAWCDLDTSIMSGTNAFDSIYGAPFFSYASTRPEFSAAFDHAMDAIVPFAAAPLLQMDWSPIETVVDVAGGSGSLLRLLLDAHPHLRGVLFDQPHVVSAGQTAMIDAGFDSRTTVVGGDMFESVPAGADAYILSQVLHDWDDAAATRILRRVREAMRHDSQLIVLELVVKDDGGDHLANWVDLNMLTVLGGCERTLDEWQHLLQASGFAIAAVLPGRRSSAIVTEPLTTDTASDPASCAAEA